MCRILFQNRHKVLIIFRTCCFLFVGYSVFVDFVHPLFVFKSNSLARRCGNCDKISIFKTVTDFLPLMKKNDKRAAKSRPRHKKYI